MNVNTQKSSKKGLLVIVLLLIVSLILNGVLFSNLVSQESVISNKQRDKLEKKDAVILNLEDKIKELQSTISNSVPEVKKQISETKLEEQQAYKGVANEFIKNYLNYSTNTLTERRDKLIPITDKDLVNKLAPEESEDNDNSLSSDPAFTSKVISSKIYITDINDALKSSEIIADVSYKAKGSEGETTVRTFIYIQLKTENNGNIKVTNYVYYPITKVN